MESSGEMRENLIQLSEARVQACPLNTAKVSHLRLIELHVCTGLKEYSLSHGVPSSITFRSHSICTIHYSEPFTSIGVAVSMPETRTYRCKYKHLLVAYCSLNAL